MGPRPFDGEDSAGTDCWIMTAAMGRIFSMGRIVNCFCSKNTWPNVSKKGPEHRGGWAFGEGPSAFKLRFTASCLFWSLNLGFHGLSLQPVDEKQAKWNKTRRRSVSGMPLRRRTAVGPCGRPLWETGWTMSRRVHWSLFSSGVTRAGCIRIRIRIFIRINININVNTNISFSIWLLLEAF